MWQATDPDDDKLAYPMLETARRLGVRHVCLHKGLPFAGTSDDDWHPRDLERAARDFPDLHFVVYHAGFRSLAGRLLNASGFDVVGDAADGEEALTVTRRLHPDIVLLDVQMPGQNGFSVARQLLQESTSWLWS